MRIKAILSVSAVVLALFAGAAQATVITRDVTIDLETDGRVIAFSNQDAWEGIVNIEDTSFNTGDTILINVRFANSKGLELRNPGTNPLNNGLELTKLTFLFETPNGASYRASGFFTYVGVDGDLLSNPTYWDINGGGGAFVGPFWHSNLTDTSFSYSGINIEINFDPSSINEDFFECGMPPCVFDRIEWSSAAEDVRIVDAAPVPEPTYTCAGFEPPFDSKIILKRKIKRAIPVKMKLFDFDGNPITDQDVSAPPLVDVNYEQDTTLGQGYDVDLVPPGLSDDGNEFRYDPVEGLWIINLSTKQFTASGNYSVTAVAPVDSGYSIEPTCAETFERLP